MRHIPTLDFQAKRSKLVTMELSVSALNDFFLILKEFDENEIDLRLCSLYDN